jgi:Ni/Fe-hydrogenase subunit HybB-like protein
MAGLAVPLVVSVHSEVSLLFASGQIPGWHSTIFPPYFVLGAAFSGLAVVAIIAIALRSLFGVENLVTDDHFDLLGKVLLATGLMTGYGYVFEVFDTFYSGNAHEMQTLVDRAAGAYAWTYWGAIIFNFVPLQALWWRSARRSHWSLLLISISVAIGMWLERYMILVTSLYRDFLVSSWSKFTPTFWDWSTYFGTIGLFLVPFLIAIRVIPSISIFETKELLHEEQEEMGRG